MPVQYVCDEPHPKPMNQWFGRTVHVFETKCDKADTEGGWLHAERVYAYRCTQHCHIWEDKERGVFLAAPNTGFFDDEEPWPLHEHIGPAASGRWVRILPCVHERGQS